MAMTLPGPHSPCRSTLQREWAFASPHRMRHEGGSTRGREGTPPQFWSASCTPWAPPRGASVACSERCCHPTSLPSQGEVHEAKCPSTFSGNIPGTERKKHTWAWILKVMASKNKQSFAVSSKNRFMANRRNLFSCSRLKKPMHANN